MTKSLSSEISLKKMTFESSELQISVIDDFLETFKPQFLLSERTFESSEPQISVIDDFPETFTPQGSLSTVMHMVPDAQT